MGTGNKKTNIACDVCGRRFREKEFDIQEDEISMLDGSIMTLDYLICPKCKSIYKILLCDRQYYRQLVDDLTAALRSQEKAAGTNDYDRKRAVAQKKAERLRTYVQKVNQKWPGSFTAAATENNGAEKIIYRPLVNADS